VDRTLFLAGVSGVIGRRLAPLLAAEGWRVVGMTRSREKAAGLRALGIEAVIVDVFDALSLTAAVAEAEPEVIVHQLTDLPPVLDPARMVEATARNARIRDEGTRNLVQAAVGARARRFIAQSIAFAYAEGPTPHDEGDALAVAAEGRAGVSARGVASLEAQTLAAPFDGAVLRYGRLYGPGTGFESPAGAAPLHVDAAAKAVLLVLAHGARGIFNIAEDDGAVSSEKAKQELHWSATWRSTLEAQH
jgi:nucleoside-diphosphate-sugar epimerase